MNAWRAQNGLPSSASSPSDETGGEGIAATYVQMKGGSFYVGDTAEEVEPLESELVPNASAGGAATTNNAAVLFAYGAGVADCWGAK